MDARPKWTIARLFAGRPVPLRLFRAIRKKVESIGPVKVVPTKTQVSFRARTGFAWVWLPQMWIEKAAEDGVVLTLDLRRRVVHPRIKTAVEPSPGRWTHHIVILKEDDLDDNVLGWLREAYAGGAREKSDRGRSGEGTLKSRGGTPSL